MDWHVLRVTYLSQASNCDQDRIGESPRFPAWNDGFTNPCDTICAASGWGSDDSVRAT